MFICNSGLILISLAKSMFPVYFQNVNEVLKSFIFNTNLHVQIVILSSAIISVNCLFSQRHSFLLEATAEVIVDYQENTL